MDMTFLFVLTAVLKESPRNVQATPLNSTSVTVTWSPPAASAGVGVIVSYVVRYQENIPRSRFQVAHVNSDKILVSVELLAVR